MNLEEYIPPESVSVALELLQVDGPVAFKWGGRWSLEYSGFHLVNAQGKSKDYYFKSDPTRSSPTVLAVGGSPPGPGGSVPLEIGGPHELALLTLVADWIHRTSSSAQMAHYLDDRYCEDKTDNLSELAACAFVHAADTERFSYLSDLLWDPHELGDNKK